MRPARAPEFLLLEGLHPYANPVDADAPECLQLRSRQRFRARFHGVFPDTGKIEAFSQGITQSGNFLRLQNRWRPASPVDEGCHVAEGVDTGCVETNLIDNGVDIM